LTRGDESYYSWSLWEYQVHNFFSLVDSELWGYHETENRQGGIRIVVVMSILVW
jgi:uncharacterized membrane protein